MVVAKQQKIKLFLNTITMTMTRTTMVTITINNNNSHDKTTLLTEHSAAVTGLFCLAIL